MKKAGLILVLSLLMTGCDYFLPITSSSSSSSNSIHVWVPSNNTSSESSIYTSSSNNKVSSNISSNSSSNNKVSSSSSSSNKVSSSSSSSKVSSATSNSSSSSNVSSSTSSNKVSSNSSSLVSSNSSSSSSNKVSSATSNSSSSNKVSSSSTSSSNEKKIIDIYAINDYHGRVLEDKEDNVPGISKLSSYLKEQKSKNDDGFIFINSGDYWQDTYDSAMNKGALLTECLDVMECEVLALGNHEFDWGLNIIRDNKELVSYTKFLGANIYNYPNTSVKSDLADNYKIVERDGLKVGIIGGIGEGQITSITSNVWENLTFTNPSTVVKKLSDELRTQKDCDIVVLSIHADQDDAYQSEITKVSSTSGKRYVDAVFCAHSHQEEISTVNGVPFIQGGEHGKYVSHVQFTYQNGNLSTIYTQNDGYGKMNSYNEDPEINKIINKYLTSDHNSNKNEVIGNITSSGGYISTKYAGRIQAKATYDYLSTLGYDVDIVINNGGRDSVNSGQMTREKIFNMSPFTNYTYVVENIKGSDIYGEVVSYTNPYYWSNPSVTLDQSKYYTVACIDYMMLHKNTSRYYNYFKTYDEDNVVYIIEDYPNVIMERYLKNKTYNIYDFNTNNYTCLQKES